MKTKVEVSHAAYSKLMAMLDGFGQHTMVNVESSCPWIPRSIVIYQRDVLLAVLKITQVLPAWKASPFTEVAETRSVWAIAAFPEQWMHGSDACSTCWVLCWCCVAMIRHLKCFFLRVLFKNSFPQLNVLSYLPSTFPPLLPVINQKLSVDIRTQHGLNQSRLILITCIMLVLRNHSELGDLAKKKK